ncbi:bifunctional DNA primase/polymerase [Actinoalloteichus caeruleus]|uniref:Bifunctional DNA primase/polymerase, N-terminal n=1 Tax=Actinoalloteichus caeruleus DSM 43889 TaxID=1120930 RepID=A0ABT1JEU3_ACTCY|nr:bifunctional DNA primase/polymerase [Actinoalloteichus caeruleus]MCP2330734.1 Bifunctional DNA primase/polymerase, N-terminal [Actinoalloteichus caeruleus DSM 43889]
MSESELMRAALAAARRGWHVFPCRAGRKPPAVRSWEDRATTDADRIRRCWAAGEWNIGVAAGPSQLVVIDLDVAKPGEHPPRGLGHAGISGGLDSLTALAEDEGAPLADLLDTYTVRTPSGGEHLYFQAPPGCGVRCSAGRLARWIDVRAAGGYVLGAGSVGPGGPYTPTGADHIAELPGWITRRLADRPAPAISAPRQTAVTHPDAYVQAALDGEWRRVRTAQPGGRNQALFVAAASLGRLVAAGRLTEVEVRRHLDQATTPHVPAAYTQRERDATVTSGIRHGIRRGGHPAGRDTAA